MTFDAAVATDFGTALAELRDKVGGMTGWSVADTSTNGGAASVPPGEWWVWSLPSGEYIRAWFRDGMVYTDQYLTFQYGPDWDSTNDVWNDRYPEDWEEHDWDQTIYSDKQGLNFRNDKTQILETDAVTYWLEYVAGAGFVFYLQREEGDGSDGDGFAGFAEINQLWDYDAAANRESNYIQLIGGYVLQSEGDNQDPVTYEAAMAESGWDTNDQPYLIKANGMVNPDANYSNYPYIEGVVGSGSYTNSDGENAIIGTYDLGLHDLSGGDAAHRDTVQDSGGSNVYTILKRNVAELGMRMD